MDFKVSILPPIFEYTGRMYFLHSMEKICNLSGVLMEKHVQSDNQMVNMEITGCPKNVLRLINNRTMFEISFGLR